MAERRSTEALVLALADAGLLYATKKRGLNATRDAAMAAFPDAYHISTWALLGQRTGHEWFTCSDCAEVRMLKVRARSRCKLTPHCSGAMIRLAPRPRRSPRRRVAPPHASDQPVASAATG